MHRTLRIVGYLALIYSSGFCQRLAAQEIWSGLGPNLLWSSGGNWQDGTAPVSGPTQHVILQGTVQISSAADHEPFFELNRLTMAPDTIRQLIGLLRFSGVNPLIESTGAFPTSMGRFQLNAPVVEVRGGTTFNGKLTLGGAISDVGGPRELKLTSGNVAFGATAYAGTTVVDGASLTLNTAAAFAPAAGITLRSGAFGSDTSLPSGQPVAISTPTSIEGDVSWLNVKFDGPVTLSGVRTLNINRTSSVYGNHSAVFAGNIGESSPGAGIIKKGLGILNLRGTTTFSGPLIVEEGPLGASSAIGSALTPLGGVEFKANSEFRSVLGGITNAADKWFTARMGSRILTDSVASHVPIAGAGVDLQAGAIFNVVLRGDTTGNGNNGFYSQLDVSGGVKLGDGVDGPILNLARPFSYFPSIGTQFMVIKNDLLDPVVGTFNGLPEGKMFYENQALAYRITYAGGDGNDVVVTRVELPEPTSAVLLSLAICMAARLKRRVPLASCQ